MPARMSVASERQKRILALLADGPYSLEQIVERLDPPVCDKTVRQMLHALRRRFPEQIQREYGGDARRVLWSLRGLPPVPLGEPLSWLTHDELAALIAARGFLRAPDARNPGWERPSMPYAGDLSAALHGLLDRVGLAEEARAIAPGTISVSRFAVAAEPVGAVAGIERALRTGRAIRFRYRNRQGVERAVFAMPMRLTAIRGEWHVFSWVASEGGGGRVKQYRLSRFQGQNPVEVTGHRPAGCPARLPQEDVDRMLASGFNATSSADPSHRRRVVVAVGPEAWPDVVDRTWGEAQIVTDAPEHGDGWRRLTFVTSGWQEARGWVLSLGANAFVEAPIELIDWIRRQLKEMALRYPSCELYHHAPQH